MRYIYASAASFSRFQVGTRDHLQCAIWSCVKGLALVVVSKQSWISDGFSLTYSFDKR